MKSTLRKIALLGALVITLGITIYSVYAADHSEALVAATVNNLLATRAQVSAIAVTAGGAQATVKFYDTATAETNVTNAAYITVTTVATNIAFIHTNSLGLTQTNTLAGIFTTTSTNAAGTNEAPTVLTLVVPAGATMTRYTTINLANGLTALSDAAATVTVTYQP